MGYIIAFDGIDASGKTTQIKMLYDRLKDLGYDVLYLTFPDYDSESSALVRLYLNGGFGKKPEDVNPYAASSFYAVDRYASYMNMDGKTGWKEFYERANSIILANRYTTANAIHQMPKLNKDKWDKFLDWLWDFEYEKLKIPKPDLIVMFDMHIDVALKLLEERTDVNNTKKDIHEADPHYLKNSYEAGKYAADYLQWENLICYFQDEDNNLIPKSREEINRDLFDLIKSKIGVS